MKVLNERQAYDMAGAYISDSDMERDIKFDQFFRHYRFRITDTVTHEILVQARQENLDFLITKE